MELSGIDYVFYSDIHPKNVKNIFFKHLTNKWLNPIITDDSSDINLDIFFEKDKFMQNEDNGYSLNDSGEGPFYLLCSKVEKLNFDIIVENEKYEMQKFGSPEQYKSKLILNEIYLYTLVLPANIDESIFCSEIYQMLVKSFLVI